MSIQENKMGAMPINKLLISMSLPMMVSMLVQALYNIVDSIFVAQISENALTAASLAFPAQQLMISVSTGTAIGVNAILSRYLGAKNPKKASDTAKCGIFLSFISCIIFAVCGYFFTESFFRFQTKDTELISLGCSYLSICTVFSLGLFGQVIFERLLVSTGKTKLSMMSQLIGAVTNIILDPILIFGLLGFPKMGIAGAAIATVISQWLAAIIALVLNIMYNSDISISFKGFVPSKRIIGKIYAIGVPSIIMVSIASVMTFFLNKILIGFSNTAAAVFGVYFRLQSFVFMPIFGLNNGMVPIIAYNYGATKPARIMETIKYALVYAMSIMLAGLAAVQLFPEFFLKFFKASEMMLAIGVPALRTISLSFIFAGICIVLSSVFQALGRGLASMIISILRQLVILLPAAYLLSLTGNVDMVWWAFPIAEIGAIVLSMLMMISIYKKIIRPLGGKSNA